MADIIVTAQKRQESANTVPMSISAATGEQLAAQGVTEIRDLVKIVPGFTFADSGAGLPILTIRGVGFIDNALGGRPTVSTYVDEAPITFPVQTRGTNLDLERVEVLKGPQGTLFGQNATGGAINFIAAKPTTTFKAGMNASYGRFNEFDVSGFVSGPITDTLLARFAVQHEGGDGWQKSYTRGDTLGRTDFTNGRLLLDWRPSDRFRAQLNLSAWADRSDMLAGQYIGFSPGNPAVASLVPDLAAYPRAPRTPRAADWNPETNYARNNEFYQANLRLDYDISDQLTLTSLTSFTKTDINQDIDVDGTAIRNNDQRTLGDIRSISQELRLAGDFGRGKFVLGATYGHDRVLDDTYNTPTYSTLGFTFVPLGLPQFTNFHNVNHQRVTTKAVFGNVDFELADTLKVSGGVRYTDSRDKFNGCTFDSGDGNGASVFGPLWDFLRGSSIPVAPGGCLTVNENLIPQVVRDNLNEDNVSWRVGVEWKPASRTLLYANVSKGYKAGGFPTLGATNTFQFRPATQESVLAYEVGFKTALLDRSVQLNGALFYYDYTDKQILGRVPSVIGPLLALVNVPKGDVRGAELQVNWAPLRGLTINAGGSYIKSRILDNFTNYDSFGALRNFNHEPFPNTPKWQLMADVNYKTSLNGRFDGFVGGNVNHQSSTNSAFGQSDLFALKAYTTVDLRAGIETKSGDWRLSIWGRNVGNTYYWNQAFVAVDAVTRYVGKPATYGVSLAYRFN
ncbi:TonB-dependent receptor [Sphingobium sp. AN641]|uniref:TonB-dependent receptor n=1 Tax=Sphingobium sp. AN641 TaxID=3133443 RepID=UPI0030C0C54A